MKYFFFAEQKCPSEREKKMNTFVWMHIPQPQAPPGETSDPTSPTVGQWEDEGIGAGGRILVVSSYQHQGHFHKTKEKKVVHMSLCSL